MKKKNSPHHSGQDILMVDRHAWHPGPPTTATWLAAEPAQLFVAALSRLLPALCLESGESSFSIFSPQSHPTLSVYVLTDLKKEHPICPPRPPLPVTVYTSPGVPTSESGLRGSGSDKCGEDPA